MSKFTFVMPDGQLLTLTGPANATQAQAEKIYLEQLAAGALVGLAPGDTLISPEVKALKFELSRLDRGTAGVDEIPAVSINNNQVLTNLPPVGDVQVQNPINTSNVIAVTSVRGLTIESVGPLSSTQIRSVMAQIAAAVDQPAGIISQEKGIGKYGFNAPQLEKSGHLKPGTSCRFLGLKPVPVTPNKLSREPQFMLPPQAQPNPNNFETVMRSPNVWTGKDGVTTLDHMLINAPLQDNIQQGLIVSSYNDLVETGQIVTASTSATQPTSAVYAPTTNSSNLGAVATLGLGAATALISSGALSKLSSSGVGGISSGTGSLTSMASSGVAQLGGLLSGASKFGVASATAWIKGITPDGLTTNLNNLSKQGQFAVNFSDFKLPNAVSGVVPAAGFANTVDRQTVDATTAKLIGTSKIPTPAFNGTSIDGVYNTNIAGSASALLNNIPGAGAITSNLPNVSGLPNIGNITGTLPSVSGLPSLATPGIAGPTRTSGTGLG